MLYVFWYSFGSSVVRSLIVILFGVAFGVFLRFTLPFRCFCVVPNERVTNLLETNQHEQLHDRTRNTQRCYAAGIVPGTRSTRRLRGHATLLALVTIRTCLLWSGRIDALSFIIRMRHSLDRLIALQEEKNIKREGEREEERKRECMGKIVPCACSIISRSARYYDDSVRETKPTSRENKNDAIRASKTTHAEGFLPACTANA